MKSLLASLTGGRMDLPLFSSCTSFEFPNSEYILYSGDPKMVFEVLDEIGTGDDTPRFFRQVEHNNGEVDFLVPVDCFDEGWFVGKSVREVTDHIEGVMDALEGWYVAEVEDLDQYE